MQTIAGFLPLTRMLAGVRRIVNDGAVLADVMPDLLFLGAVSLVCLSLASWLFSWTE